MLGLPRGPLAAFAAFALAAAVYLFGIWLPQRDAPATDGWVTTPLTITETRIETESRSEAWGNTTREYTVYTPVIAYTYTVDGTVYAGEARRQARLAARDEAEARATLAAYPGGSTHTGYVNPALPAESALFPQAKDNANRVAILLGAGLLVIIGLVALIAPYLIPRGLGTEGRAGDTSS